MLIKHHLKATVEISDHKIDAIQDFRSFKQKNIIHFPLYTNSDILGSICIKELKPRR
jgi:hypothetical protein